MGRRDGDSLSLGRKYRVPNKDGTHYSDLTDLSRQVCLTITSPRSVHMDRGDGLKKYLNLFLSIFFYSQPHCFSTF